MEFEVTKLGERGQVVIPQGFRESMHLEKGEKFMVIERGDMLIFKRMKEPTLKDFNIMIGKGHSHAEKNKLSEKDLATALRRARSRR